MAVCAYRLSTPAARGSLHHRAIDQPMKTNAATPQRARATEAPTPSSQPGSVGWLASGAGLMALTGAMFLPPVVSLPLTAVAAVVGLGVLGLARARSGPGAGHGVAGLVTALVGLLLVVSSALLPELGLGLLNVGSRDVGEAPPSADSEAPPSADPTDDPLNGSGVPHQPVVLRPVDVQASGTAAASQDAAGNPVTFEAANVVDGDPTTAWRIGGNGVGDYLILTFDRLVHIESVAVIPGYAKVDPADGADRFRQNRRVRSVVFGFPSGEDFPFTFVDDPQLQVVPMGIDTSQMAMQITSSSSAQRDFTAISEIQVTGWVVG